MIQQNLEKLVGFGLIENAQAVLSQIKSMEPVLVQTRLKRSRPGVNRTEHGTGSLQGRHFDQEIIVLCVRWYLAFKLSSCDLVQMMAE